MRPQTNKEESISFWSKLQSKDISKWDLWQSNLLENVDGRAMTGKK